MSSILSLWCQRRRMRDRQQQQRRQSLSFSAFIMFLLLFFSLTTTTLVQAQFGRKKRREAEAAAAAAAEVERRSNLVVIGDMEVDKTVFYIITGLIGLALAAFLLFDIPIIGSGSGSSSKRRPRGNRPNNEKENGNTTTVDVIVVGIGLPKKGMGWYHLTQLLEMKTVNVRAIVEPFYLNPELCSEPPQSFLDLIQELKEMDILCFKSMLELAQEIGANNNTDTDADSFDDDSSSSTTTLCFLAARTVDNPRLFEECIHYNLAKYIYLEKPGAPTVSELDSMRLMAEKSNVTVYLGYNKNVTPYIQKTIALAKTVENAHVFLCHNNSYTQADLPEVFFRNSEGMLKNMAVHELAILVTFFDVTVSNIAKFKVNTSKLFSEKLSIWKPGTSLPNPEYVTDFSRIAFKITTKSGKNVSVMADRCGGNVSFAVVKDENGKEVNKFEFPDPKMAALVEEQVAEDPEMMPYFFVQSDDYQELKNRVVQSILLEGGGGDGKRRSPTTTKASGVATIQVGIEALKLAEYATDELNKALSKPK